MSNLPQSELNGANPNLPAPKRLADIPGLLEAFKQIRNREVPPTPDLLAEVRAVAWVLGFLQHDTPERQALLTAAGVDQAALPSDALGCFAAKFFDGADSVEAGERGLQWWEKCRAKAAEPQPTEEGFVTRRLSEVLAQDVEWLWDQRIPIGSLSLISGDPGLGKTWVTLDILARITTGRDFPDSPNQFFRTRRDVLWVSAEDADEDTIKPRLLTLGGDPSRFHSLSCVWSADHDTRRGAKPTPPREQTLDLSRHLEQLDDWLAAHPLVAAVAIDPLAAFLGRTDTHHNSDVRGLLTPLNKIAREHRVAIIGINHLSKGGGNKAVYRSIGSIAFVAAARSSWQVSSDPKGPKDRRLLTKVKANLASGDVGGLAFRLQEHCGVWWEPGTIETTADEVLSADDGTRAPARTEAKEWLQELLKDGPVPAADVRSRADAEGQSWNTVKAASNELGVKTTKTGGTGAPWVWSLPKK